MDTNPTPPDVLTEEELREVMEADCVFLLDDFINPQCYEDCLCAGLCAGLTLRQADRVAYHMTHSLEYEPEDDE
jgi:hypothetical protein